MKIIFFNILLAFSVTLNIYFIDCTIKYWFRWYFLNLCNELYWDKVKNVEQKNVLQILSISILRYSTSEFSA